MKALPLLLTLTATAMVPLPTAASEGEAAQTAGTGVLSREVEQGPVRLVLNIVPSRPALSDRLQVTLTLEALAGVEVFPPEFADRLGDFRVVERHDERPHLGLEVDRYRYRLVLEPRKAGSCRLLPIAVNFRDPRQGPGAERQTVESPPLSIPVVSHIAPDDARLQAAAELEGPVAPPASAWPLVALCGGLVSVALAAALAGWWAVRRLGGPKAEPEVSPGETALRDLERLREEGWAQRDVKVFFVRLTGIVRRFLERTTGVLAVEQTTEEFLREIGTNPRFAVEDRARLKDFLESADVVKFAAHRPSPEDVERSLGAARELILGSLMAEETG